MKKDRTSRQIIRLSLKSPIGEIGITASDEGLLTVNLHPQSAAKEQPSQAPAQLARLIERLETYFSGAEVSFPDKLDLSNATSFQTKVWEATRLIPYGETRSYRWVAEQIGQPAAVRAVGQALGRNPLPVIIPCHRVIAGDGKLGGYSGGLEMKRTLLRLERRVP